MSGTAQNKNINQHIEKFLTEHGSDELLALWRCEENMSVFNKLTSKLSTKKNKKTKDPNKPKRGKSAYIFFCADNRVAAKEELGNDAKVTEVTSKLGEMWGVLKASEKATDKKKMAGYEKQALEDKERYDTNMKGYEAPSGDELEKEKDEKKKSAKKNKDPNKPKRGKSAYIFFCTDNRATVKEELGNDAKATEVTSKLGEMWTELKNDEDRAEELEGYKKQAMDDKLRYDEELKNYNPDDEPEPKKKKTNPVKKKGSTKKASTKKESPKKESPKKESPKKESPKKESPKKDSPKKESLKNSPYIYFCREHREEIKQSNPDISASDVTKQLSDMWKDLNKDEQQEWADAAEAEAENE